MHVWLFDSSGLSVWQSKPEFSPCLVKLMINWGVKSRAALSPLSPCQVQSGNKWRQISDRTVRKYIGSVSFSPIHRFTIFINIIHFSLIFSLWPPILKPCGHRANHIVKRLLSFGCWINSPNHIYVTDSIPPDSSDNWAEVSLFDARWLDVDEQAFCQSRSQTINRGDLFLGHMVIFWISFLIKRAICFAILPL